MLSSPLNVVHVGIELLRDQLLKNRFIESCVVELINDVYTSSEAAINILSDLLNFENIDAGLSSFVLSPIPLVQVESTGTLKLEMSWVSILHPFDNRLKWADALCRTRNIQFHVNDSITCSAAGTMVNRFRAINTSPRNYELNDIEGKFFLLDKIFSCCLFKLRTFRWVLIFFFCRRRRRGKYTIFGGE